VKGRGKLEIKKFREGELES